MRKPILIFDGDCGFCRKWIAYWRGLTGNQVEYAPYQEVGSHYRQIKPADFEKSVQLVRSDGSVLQGAAAVFGALAVRRNLRWLSWAYAKVPGVRVVTEACYRFVAQNRVLFSRLTRMLWGDEIEPPRYVLTRWIYLKALGACYVAAFSSFWVQASGLVGPQGILPSGWSDAALSVICATGVAAGALLVLGVASLAATIVAWVAYGFVVRAGQEFLGFQWDALMLEMGFFSIFLTLGRREPLRLAVLILRWLLFRVVFFSGYVKLASHDPTWRDLSALRYHFETQPLPTWIGWGFHQLPPWALKFCVIAVFVVELAVPVLYFFPRRPRIFAFFATLFLQMLINATGNYGFFGWQTVALCLLLLDDAWLERMFRGLSRVTSRPKLKRAAEHPVRVRINHVFVGAAAFMVFFTTVFPWTWLRDRVAVLDSIHSYGVFAVMTTERDELIFEGSRDGVNWEPYELKWKPGDLSRRPGFCEPHMPRLDWQLWFAALSGPGQNPWVEALAVRLLEGSPSVNALFDKNPFAETPPRSIRASFYRYHFTDLSTLRHTGQWWRREPLGLYLPPVALR